MQLLQVLDQVSSFLVEQAAAGARPRERAKTKLTFVFPFRSNQSS